MWTRVGLRHQNGADRARLADRAREIAAASCPTMWMARTPCAIAANDSSSFGIIPLVTTPSAIAFLPSATVSVRDARRRIVDVAQHAGDVGHEDERAARRARPRRWLATMSALML